MTEKRYVIEEIGNMFRVLKDNEPLTTKFENYDKQDVTNLITELNELAEENKELKDKNSRLQETLAFRSNQLALMEQLIDDLGHGEMQRQMEEILND